MTQSRMTVDNRGRGRDEAARVVGRVRPGRAGLATARRSERWRDTDAALKEEFRRLAQAETDQEG